MQKDNKVDKNIEKIIYEMMEPNTLELAKTVNILAKTLNLILYPLEKIVDNKEEIVKFLSLKINKRFQNCPENVSPPPKDIGLSILQRLFLEDDEILKTMYANLLLNSMDKRFDEIAHKSFIRVLENLSPDEVKIIEHIANVCSDNLEKYGEDEICDALSQGSIEEEFSNFLKKIDIERHSYSDFYLDNLLRLGILKSKFHIGDIKYHPSGYTDRGDYEPSVEEESVTVLYFTTFGYKFIKSCTENLK